MNDDQGNVRLAIIVLGVLALTCLIGGIVIVLNDKSLPDALIAIGASAATAITLVITRPVGGVQSVEVVNRDAEPVPVDPVPAKRAAKAAKR